MTPEQSKAARMLLGWTQKDLAEAALVSEWSVKRFEAGHDTGARTVKLIHRAYAPLVAFLPEDHEGGVGVRLRKGVSLSEPSNDGQGAVPSVRASKSSTSGGPFNDAVRGPVARAVFRRGRWWMLPRQTRRILRAWLWTDRQVEEGARAGE